MEIENRLILVVSIIIAIASIIMPFTHINKKFGVRTKWSMYNKNTWFYSNLIGSIFMLIASGITIFSFFFFPSVLKVIFISSIIIAAILSALFSYFAYMFEVHKKP